MTHLFSAFFRFLCLLLPGQISITKPTWDIRSSRSREGVEPAITGRPFLKVERIPRSQSQVVRLEVVFRVSRYSPVNRYLFPYVSIPFFAGAPGFLSKMFYFNPLNLTYSGFYEWTDRDSIKDYLNSYADRFMTGISAPGSLKYRIYAVPGNAKSSPQIQSIVRQ